MSSRMSMFFPFALVRRLILLAALAAVAAAAFSAWVFVAHVLRSGEPVGSTSLRPTAVVWGNRVFTDRSSIEAWLRVRGVAYPVWAKRNPSLAATIDPAARAAARSVRAVGARPAKKRSAPVPAPAPAAAPAADHRFATVTKVAEVALLVVLLAAAAFVLARYARTVEWERLRSAARSHRHWVADPDGHVRGEVIALAVGGVLAIACGFMVAAVA
jgi:hypothetical protein